MTNTHLKSTYCCEPLELVESYAAAKADNFAGWCIHHRLEIQPDGTRMSVQELKDKNLYFHRPASELVFMKVCEHMTLHRTGKHHSAETLQKMSGANKGKRHSAEARQKMSKARKGKTLSEETRLKMSKSRKGTRWWNNGISNTRSRECPGEGWTRGRLSSGFKYCM